MPPKTITAEKIIEFAETDAAGLVHFSNYFRYVEIAERTLFESLGEPLLQESNGLLTGFPRLRAKCDFSAPLAFGDRIRIELSIAEVTERTLHYIFKIYKREQNNDWTRAAKGEMVTVFAQKEQPSGVIRPEQIPEPLRSKLLALRLKSDEEPS